MKQYLEAGQIRPLIIFAKQRLAAFPDVPTSTELGLDITLPQFRGMVAKKGLPPDRIKLLADAFKKAMDTPEWKQFAAEWYISTDSYLGPEEYAKWVTEEVATLERLINEFGLRK